MIVEHLLGTATGPGRGWECVTCGERLDDVAGVPIPTLGEAWWCVHCWDWRKRRQLAPAPTLFADDDQLPI